MPLERADDAWQRERAKRRPAPRVEAVDGLDQRQHRLPEILKQLAAAGSGAPNRGRGAEPLDQRLAPFAIPGAANAAVRFDPDAGPSCSLEQPPRGRSGCRLRTGSTVDLVAVGRCLVAFLARRRPARFGRDSWPRSPASSARYSWGDAARASSPGPAAKRGRVGCYRATSPLLRSDFAQSTAGRRRTATSRTVSSQRRRAVP
jgi:hypothetical protein